MRVGKVEKSPFPGLISTVVEQVVLSKAERTVLQRAVGLLNEITDRAGAYAGHDPKEEDHPYEILHEQCVMGGAHIRDLLEEHEQHGGIRLV